MLTAQVAGTVALYPRVETRRPSGVWRQWSLNLEAHAVRIVSAMPKGREAALAPAIDGMVASSRPVPTTTAAPAR